MKVRIAALEESEVEALSKLAAEIWRAHYPAIIGSAQTEYMLAQRYDPRVIRQELGGGDIWWDTLHADGTMIGFSSALVADTPRALKLDKLYVHPAHQRRGFGGMLIEHACQRAKRLEYEKVILAVNKNNASAIAAYRKHGFEVTQAVVKEIGGGFVMDDYVLEKKV